MKKAGFSPKKYDASDFGLYIHIPFCAFLCHYCDFPKTARFDADLTKAFFAHLAQHLEGWLTTLTPTPRLTSVFLGGGTPGLFSREFSSTFAAFRPWLEAGAEITLEANPNDLSTERLMVWRDLGVTRLSVGVQSFQDEGLKFLTRQHRRGETIKNLKAAKAFFPNLNMDLIFGWPGQTLDLLAADLAILMDLGLPHVSIYNLSYEARTPIGRRFHRGHLKGKSEEELADQYELIRTSLGGAGYEHEEVANWAKPGFSCRHNFLYWTGLPYLGVGPGAHSYIPGPGGGSRFSYPKSLKHFLATPLSRHENLNRMATQAGLTWEERGQGEWLLEYVGCGLRAATGISLGYIKEAAGLSFNPRPLVKEGLAAKLLTEDDNHLYLSRNEWIRETAWALEVALSFQ